MSRRLVSAWLLVMLAGLPARAQVPFARDLVPTRTALARLGLERQWMAIIPLVNDERLMSISQAEDMVFAQTNRANFHAIQAESGQLLWSTNLGNLTARPRGASVNSFAVFATNLNSLFALDRRTGRTIWVKDLGILPASPTACDEERVMVGLGDGKIYAYELKVKKDGKSRISDKPLEAWNWKTDGEVESRPLPASRVVAFGSSDGKVYVAFADERTMLYRIATGGPIGAGLGAFGTRLLLIPSQDRNLYGVDLFTAKVLWSFPSGAPIEQEPLVADNEIYVVNSAGLLSSIDPNSGSARWTTSTQGGRLVAVGGKRIYLKSQDGDLFINDRATGQTIADPRATLERVGLNLRPYDRGLTNRLNDRLYLATTSGMVLCLREIGLTTPRLLRDPKAPAFGYIPVSGLATTPPASPAAEDAPAPAEDNSAPAGDKPAEPDGDKPDKPAPAGGDVPAPAPGGDAEK